MPSSVGTAKIKCPECEAEITVVGLLRTLPRTSFDEPLRVRVEIDLQQHLEEHYSAAS